MTTALAVYPSSLAASTLSSAGALPTTTGATTTTGNTTAIGSATGWGEVPALGTAHAWAAGGAQGSPTGKGWFLDPSTLDGQTIVTGNWTPTVNMAGGTFTASIYVRAYVYNSGVYTLIGSMSLLSQSFTTTQKAYAFSATSLVAANFPTGSHLYIDLWLNVTSNSGGAGTTIKIRLSTSSTQGNTASQVVTPGYQTTASSVSLSVTVAGAGALTGTLTGTAPTGGSIPGWTLIQSAVGAVGASNASSVTVTTLATGSNNLLLAWVVVTGAILSVTPPAGWSQLGTSAVFGSGTGFLALYSKISTGGVASHVFSFSSACNAAVAFQEWGGASTSTPLDQIVTSSVVKQLQTTTGTTPTLKASGELGVWGIGFSASGLLSYSSVANGYVEDSNANAASNESTRAQIALFYNTAVGAAPTSSSVIKSNEGASGSATILAVFIEGSTPLSAEFDGTATLTGTLQAILPLTLEADGLGATASSFVLSNASGFLGEFDGTGTVIGGWFPIPITAEFDAAGVLAWSFTLTPTITQSLDGSGTAIGTITATTLLSAETDAVTTVLLAPSYLGVSGVLFGEIDAPATLLLTPVYSKFFSSTLAGAATLSGTPQLTTALRS